MPHVIPDVFKHLKAPYLLPEPNISPASQPDRTRRKKTHLIRRPPIPHTLRITLHVFIPLIQPALLQKLVVVLDIAQLHPSTLALDFAKDPVLVVAVRPVERAVFRRAGYAARCPLFDVDVGEAVGGGVLLDG